MPASIDTFLSLAEVSVALLGFSAIASVFYGSGSSWSPDGRFWATMSLSVISLVAALIPVSLISFDIPATSVWYVSSTFVALAMAVLFIFSLRFSSLDRQAGVPLNWGFLSLFILLMSTSLFMSIWNLAFNGMPTPAFHIASIVVMQTMSAVVFLRFLAVWLRK